jgi:ATP-dependent RNA helicase DDX46/PRP5
LINHEDVEYEPFRKNFYIESREITKMTEREVAEYRKSMGDVKVRGLKCPKPIKNWY